LSVAPVGPGPTKIVEEDNQIYNTAGIEVKPEFPGGMAKFYKYVGDNYRAPEEEGLRGKVYVTFVWKDGSLTDIKVLRDIGYGTGKEAVRVLTSPRWNPGIQNGKPVRVYTLPIQIQTADVGKGIKIFRRNRSKRFLLVIFNFVFVVYLVLGLLIIFMNFP
jgi:protein TonB